MPFLGGFSPSLVHTQPASVFAVAQNISKSLATETVTIAESSHVRLTAKTRALATQTITIGDETLARVKALIRNLATQTITVGETINRIKGAVKTVSDTTTIGDNIAKLITKVRALSETKSIAEALANLISKVRALAAQTITIAEDIDIVVTPGGAGAVIEKSLSETDVIAELSIRLKAAWRLQP